MLDKENKITEYEGYILGQKVVVTRVPDSKLSFGEIRMIHPKAQFEKSCFTFACEVCGQFRLAYFKDIIKNPTASQLKKIGVAKSRLFAPKKRKKR